MTDVKNKLLAVMTAAVLAACSAAPAPEAPGVAVAAFAAALKAGDARRAQELLAPDVLIYESGGQEASRDEYAAHHLQADMQFLKGATVQQLDQRQSLYGEVAVVTTRVRMTGSYQDKPVDQLGTETMVLRRDGASWRITHIHWSSRAAPATP